MLHYDVDLQLCYHLSTLLMTQQPGFVDVHQDRVTIPLGWGEQLGQIHGQTMEGFYQSLHPSVRQATTTDEYPEGLTEAAIQQVMMECQKYQSHCPWYACYGQKPANTSATNLVAGAMPQPDATSGIRRFSSAKNNSNSKSNSNTSVNKGAALATAGSGVPAPIVEEAAWESIDDFIDGYVD
ncbi:hypothetical protein BDB00DRAFT_313625 [Zychaea mexicana]|uniref:uncharacterized protein n=1 Tax=Zychaea mexicana TaxID=64656 RepID=UPI0022FEBE3E|nr:uncharacterized protein BDB00DRAFT_313625 [Zychaea mexicana]KAI9494370.1 hypothetical protein BDB00DRAFT_313625 [Zychaea mexicana]